MPGQPPIPGQPPPYQQQPQQPQQPQQGKYPHIQTIRSTAASTTPAQQTGQPPARPDQTAARPQDARVNEFDDEDELNG